jgi:hypothetical protein
MRPAPGQPAWCVPGACVCVCVCVFVCQRGVSLGESRAGGGANQKQQIHMQVTAMLGKDRHEWSI